MRNVKRLCTIEADMDKMKSAFEEKKKDGVKFWQLHFEVVVSFRGTTLQGKLVWMDKVC
jgi:hypothetical protein